MSVEFILGLVIGASAVCGILAIAQRIIWGDFIDQD